jgi:hypothetical protein
MGFIGIASPCPDKKHAGFTKTGSRSRDLSDIAGGFTLHNLEMSR